ncbi:type 2 lanthipeptide synthetase LanM [Kitasatospora sp. NPDC002227]|uniref:type 2 lanthipeptide synthetase LanM n=1 Tax=Kitasatospora sp. NPDC002227 TaxID=3154773 RepID=UPI003331348E
MNLTESQSGWEARLSSQWWRAGATEAELGRGRPPEWVAFLVEVLAAAPEEVGLPDGELPGLSGFTAVLAPAAAAAATRLPAELAPQLVDLPAVRAEFTARLARLLARRAARVLVAELHTARPLLAGDTPSARFRSFLRQVGSAEGLERIFAEYPALARLLAVSCLHAAEALAELLRHLGLDRAELLKAVLPGADPGPLVSVERTAGDSHRRGRAVTVLRFASGARVVHKPRSIDAHQHFNHLLDWFTGLELPTLAVLPRPGYGWVEYVAPAPCRSVDELSRFHRRQGSLLAVLHLLRATDAHRENLIARGGDPLLVDVETLFHPTPPGLADPAALVLATSVHRTGLLPRLLVGDETAVDASGAGGADGNAPLPGVGWAAAGTDRMHLVRRTGRMPAAANRPRLADGAGAGEGSLAAHAEAVLDGFRAAWAAAVTGREQLLAPDGPLRRFAEAEVRVVPRATQLYATLLDESTHPDVLRRAADRDALLHLLATDALGPATWPALAFAEAEALRDGDIPLFTTTPASGRLHAAPAAPTGVALARPGLTTAVDHLRDMADPATQEWLIRAALATHGVVAPPCGAAPAAGSLPTEAQAGASARSGRGETAGESDTADAGGAPATSGNAAGAAEATVAAGARPAAGPPARFGAVAAGRAGRSVEDGGTGSRLAAERPAGLVDGAAVVVRGGETFAEPPAVGGAGAVAVAAVAVEVGGAGAGPQPAAEPSAGPEDGAADVVRGGDTSAEPPAVGGARAEAVAAVAVELGAAAAARASRPPARPGADAPVAVRLVAEARSIGDRLLRDAHRGVGWTNWLGLELLGERYWQIRPAGGDLGNGYLGVAFFLAQLAGLTGEPRYAEAAASAVASAPRLLERLAAQPEELGVVGAGAFGGLGGIAYTLGHLAPALGSAELAACIEPAAALTLAAAERETSPALLDGTAGGLAALLSLPGRPGAAACAELLAGRPLPAHPGFGAGRAGVGWALLRYTTVTGDRRYLAAGRRALQGAVAAGGTGASWCHGRSGIALAAADSPDFTADVPREAVPARPSRDLSLRHGLLGAAEHHRPAAQARAAAAQVLAVLDRYGPYCGTPGGVPTPGLLHGLAGLGHGLLRLAHPDRTASALLLQPPSQTRLTPPTP